MTILQHQRPPHPLPSPLSLLLFCLFQAFLTINNDAKYVLTYVLSVSIYLRRTRYGVPCACFDVWVGFVSFDLVSSVNEPLSVNQPAGQISQPDKTGQVDNNNNNNKLPGSAQLSPSQAKFYSIERKKAKRYGDVAADDSVVCSVTESFAHSRIASPNMMWTNCAALCDAVLLLCWFSRSACCLYLS